MRDEARDCGKSVRTRHSIGSVPFTTPCRKVTSSVFKPRCRRRELLLVLTSEWRCYAGWMERIVSNWCGKTHISRIEAERAAIVTEWNSGGRPATWSANSSDPYVDYKTFAYCTIAQLLMYYV